MTDSFHDFVEELFEPFAPLKIKRMFGGAGVWSGQQIFAILADDVIYLKCDPALREALEAEDGEVFIWTNPKTGAVNEMQYVSLPSAALDDPEDAADWARRALDVGLKAAKAKPKKKKKKT
ncbi:MAG: TfoX/Sxy family protein [Pseudomonadota bacterium]